MCSPFVGAGRPSNQQAFRVQDLPAQVKEVEAAAERAAAQSAAIIERAMEQAEDMRRRAARDTQGQVGKHA